MTALYQYCEKCKTERAFNVLNSLDISCTKCGSKIKSVPGRSAIPAGKGLVSQVYAKTETGTGGKVLEQEAMEKEYHKMFDDVQCTWGTGARMKGVQGKQVLPDIRFIPPCSPEQAMRYIEETGWAVINTPNTNGVKFRGQTILIYPG